MPSIDNEPARPRWVATGDAAEEIGVTLRALYKLIDRGETAAYRFGRAIRLRSVHVDQFIEAHPDDLGLFLGEDGHD